MPTKTRGTAAEELVFNRLRSALPAAYRLYPNVHWLGRTAAHRQLRDGEADIVIAHADHGLLVVETKAGNIRIDAERRWWAGPNLLDPPPHRQAADSKHALVTKLLDIPDWPASVDPIAGHAIGLPDMDLATAGPGLRLPPDLEPELVFDGEKLASDTLARSAVERAFEVWGEYATNRRPPGELGMRAVDALLSTPLAFTRLIGREIKEGEESVRELTRQQLHVLRSHGRIRRAEINGCAGSGKTLIALEKACLLAREGYSTLLVCFNQPLARHLASAISTDPRAAEFVHVSTFHQLAEDLGRQAGVLPTRPEPIPQDWWDVTLPTALLEAREKLGPRYHAIVVDEGQDFAADWFATLQLLLFDERDDVFWVFHDPAQALYREDTVGQLDLVPIDLDLNCRNSGPIHGLAERFREGGAPSTSMRDEGREPKVVPAEPGQETIDALAGVLHELRTTGHVPPWDIVVLVGGSLERSEVWRHRRFGNEVLWNGQVNDDGTPNGLAADEVPDQPSDTILVDSIRRFKGLEAAVVVLVELREDDRSLRRLLHVGITRAKHHVVAIAPPSLAVKLGATPSD